MIEAVTAFFPSDEAGIGSIVYTVDERKKLAQLSRDYISPKFGSVIDHEKQIDELYQMR